MYWNNEVNNIKRLWNEQETINKWYYILKSGIFSSKDYTRISDIGSSSETKKMLLEIGLRSQPICQNMG